MMSKSHYWVVCDAVAFIKRFGSDEQKKVLQTLEMAYGEGRPIDEMAQCDTAVEKLVGFESLHTDKYADLALSFRAIPGGGKRNVTGLGFHKFTAMNHFINPYPEIEHTWASASSGYYYKASSMTGFDSVIIRGLSEHLQCVVDTENSLVLDRIRPYWNDLQDKWNRNFEEGLSDTHFAPWTVLTKFYYNNFLVNHFEPLEVRGPNQFIVGLQLLGPVVHAVADACSVQHVRSTLGFGHAVWENYLKAKVYNREINVNAKLVQQFLSESPFLPRVVADSSSEAEGRLGHFNIENFIFELSLKTANRLQESTGQPWKQLWQAGDEFWGHYLMSPSMRDDAHFLYNMSIAGTVYILVKAFDDLVSWGILSPGKGLSDPKKLPKLDLIQKKVPAMPLKKSSSDDLPSELVMQVPYSNTRDILGFDPIGKTGLPDSLSNLRSVFQGLPSVKLETGKASRLLREIESELVDQFQAREKLQGPGFCPLRIVENIPLDSDLSAHFGTATFRMPSTDECNDPKLFGEYIKLSDAHAYMANKLQLTQIVAGLKFYQLKFSGRKTEVERLKALCSDLEKLRDFGDNDLAAQAHCIDIVGSKNEFAANEAKVSLSPVKKLEAIASSAGEWFSSLFRVPVTALATVAATILLLVVLMPRGVPQPIMGLSSEKWDQPKLELMGPKSIRARSEIQEQQKKPRIGVIIQFKNLSKPLDQDTVDSLYRSLAPTVEMRAKFEFVNPAQLQSTIGKEGPGKIKTVVDAEGAMQKDLGLSGLLVINATAVDNKFSVDGEYRNLDTKESSITKYDNTVSIQDLAPALKKVAQTALLR
jgi:hypothetical protein